MYLWTTLIAFGVVVLGLVLTWWTALIVLTIAVIAVLLTTGLPRRRAAKPLAKV
jgi:UDP-GlcNAc:undecaprenyl-phosphate GlcNAc-1-phosphate transferase